jgi:alpha-L-rhamnosidase
MSLTSTWFMMKDTLVFARIATLLEKKEDAAIYTKRYGDLVVAFNKKFDDKGKYLANWMSPIDNHPSMTSQILPLYLGIVPKEEEQKAVGYLVSEIIDRFDYHVDCGIVGLRYLYPVLLHYGYDDIAYKLMGKDTYPSFGYMVRNGATTLWERWEYLAGMGMNSHNHIMYGSPNAWFYQGLCGVRRIEGKWIIKPYFPKDMDTACSDFSVKEGRIFIEWTRQSGKIVTVRWRLPLELQAEFIPPEGWGFEGKIELDKEGYSQVSCKKNS